MEENKEENKDMSKPPTEKTLLLNYLDEILTFSSQKLVGKVCKRIEIIDNLEILKRELKELIYEEYRDLRDIFAAYNKGLEVSIFNFKRSK